MRLLYFTNRDLASNVMLNHLLPLLHPYIQHIFISDKVGKANSAAPQALQDLKFFEQILPNEFLFPQLDAQAKEQKPEYQTFEALSQQYAIPITSLNDVKSEESLNLIRSLQPDLVLSIRYGRIFGDAFVQIPRLGVVNFHSGRLPNYRGVLAIFRALKNGDKAIHGTLHYIDDKTIDTGGIIGFSHLPVNPDRSLLWHILHLYPVSAAYVADQVLSILQGEKPNILAQDEAESAYFSFPSTEEIAEFEAAGWKVVDATEYAEFIRGYSKNMNYGSIVEGVVTQKRSNLLYEIHCLDGRTLVASLGKSLIFGAKLSIGAKVFVQLLPRPNNDGRILTETDFKSNNWQGWTDEHEPNFK